jgi:hypothetical protein
VIIASTPDLFLNPYQKYYAGGVRNFRAKLSEAGEVPVYPNEDAIRSILLNPEVRNVSIAYFYKEEESGYYFVTSFEITNKMTIIYRHLFGEDVDTFTDEEGNPCIIFYPNKQVRCFKSVALNSTDELNPSPANPVILLKAVSNQTAVTAHNFMITLEGESLERIEMDYIDLDLAVDKMLLVLME